MLYTEMTKENCESLVKMSTGKRIKLILDNRRLTQKDLALKVGVTKTSISRWIRGENEMGISQLAKISQEMNVSADWLLGLTDNFKEYLATKTVDVSWRVDNEPR